MFRFQRFQLLLSKIVKTFPNTKETNVFNAFRVSTSPL